MSNLNIRRVVENIRSSTSIYTPVVEVVVNAIQAITDLGRTDGRVQIRVVRSPQIEAIDSKPSIVGFQISDNGVGFTDRHRDSFDTLYSDLKAAEGGKGFGRFVCLRYFNEMHIHSVFLRGDENFQRTFRLGKANEIIVDEVVSRSSERECGTTVALDWLVKGEYEKRLTTLARTLVEKLLPYFITAGFHCPKIELSEIDGTDAIILNSFFVDGMGDGIRELACDTNSFSLSAVDAEYVFDVRLFKFLSPKNQKSKISLVAHMREVSTIPLEHYVPEFSQDFFEKTSDGDDDLARNYIVKAYVFGPYLDKNVSLERGDFEFRRESDVIYGIAQSGIERQAALIAEQALGDHITTRQQKKFERVQSYVDENAPWHKSLMQDLDISSLAVDAAPEEIESRLQRAKFSQEQQIKRDVSRLVESTSIQELSQSVAEVVKKIADTSKNDLVHYVASRKTILQLLSRSLERNVDGKFESEGAVHDIIFPRRGTSDKTFFEDHNLWLIDERLNFTSYVSSDLPLSESQLGRPDLLAFNRRIVFRGDNEPSNPVMIFEFKRPQRDDFANESSRDDPIAQIVRYVNAIKDGEYGTPKGRKVLVASGTPFYGFVVCDLTSKVERWLEREKDFTPMPDSLGWFSRFANLNLHIEVLSWDKVIRDADMRNAIFFRKLGI